MIITMQVIMMMITMIMMPWPALSISPYQVT